VQIFLSYLIIILLLVILSILGIKYLNKYHFYIKKLLHVSAILICADASIKLPTWPLFLIVLCICIVLLIAINRGFLSDPETGVKETGVVYFAAVFLIMLGIVIYFNDASILKIISYSLSILAISDGFAGIIGRWWKENFQNKSLQLPNKEGRFFVDNHKSVIGLLVFFTTSFFILQIFISRFTNLIGAEAIYLAIILATLLAILEFVSLKGSDNLTVTLFAFFSLQWIEKSSFESLFFLNVGWVSTIYWSTLVMVLITMGLGFLTFTGSLLSIFLAFVVVVLAKQSLVPLLVFLVVGSLVGKLPQYNIVSDERFSKPRNALQVFSNGGIVMFIGLFYWVLQLFGYQAIDELETSKLMLVSVAICMSDTLSSELGARFGGVPRDLLSFNKIQPGVSGGVSLLGSLFGLLGSFIIVTLGLKTTSLTLIEFFVFGFFGFFGMLLDSFLGSKFQLKEKMDGIWIDSTKKEIGKSYRGIGWISNNVVNFLSNIIIVSGLLLYYLCNK
jgi:uncharacterized protein (TIGR00297 family)